MVIGLLRKKGKGLTAFLRNNYASNTARVCARPTENVVTRIFLVLGNVAADSSELCKNLPEQTMIAIG
jgi:hypothetical protein